MTGWELERHDAPCGGPDPRVSLLPLLREKINWAGGISTVFEAISASCWYHGKRGHFSAVTVAAASDCLSFAARSSRRDHGGLHQFTSCCQT